MFKRNNVWIATLALWFTISGIVLAAGLVIDNTDQSISPKLALKSGANLGNGTGALTANGDIAFNGTDFKFRRAGADLTPGFLDLAQTWSAGQTFSALLQLDGGAQFGSFTPTVNGQIGWDGSTFLFRESGINRVMAASNGANTWAMLQSFGAGILMSSNFTPDANGEIGWDGTNLLFREAGSNKKMAAINFSNTFSTTQTFGDTIHADGGIELGTFTPTVDGQVGWDGSNFLFREGGVNRTLDGIAFSGDLNATTNKVLSDSGAGAAVRVRDDQGFNIGNAAGTYGNTMTATAAGEVTMAGRFVTKGDGVGLQVRHAGDVAVLGLRGLTGVTVDGVETELGTGGYLALASGATHSFSITVTARCTSGGNAGKSAMYRFDVVARNNAGTTALEGASLKTIVAEGATSWDATVVADDTNDRLAVKVTGAIGDTSVKWTAAIQETIIND